MVFQTVAVVMMTCLYEREREMNDFKNWISPSNHNFFFKRESLILKKRVRRRGILHSVDGLIDGLIE